MISYNESPMPPEQFTPPPVEPPKPSFKVNKGRIGNILVAATIALLVAVWTPTLVVGGAGVYEVSDWTETLETAKATHRCPKYKGKMRYRCSDKSRVRVGSFDTTGVGIWALITGVVLGGLYFVNGSLALRFSKEE